MFSGDSRPATCTWAAIWARRQVRGAAAALRLHLLRGRSAYVAQPMSVWGGPAWRTIPRGDGGYLAAGIDRKNIVFSKARFPSTPKLAWIFNCVCRMGWLGRMTQFKDKAGGMEAPRSACDLWIYGGRHSELYRATHVPVGEDQKQHLEPRAIAQKFNNDFGASIAAHGHGGRSFRCPSHDPGPTRVMSLCATAENVEVGCVDYSHQPRRRDAIAQKSKERPIRAAAARGEGPGAPSGGRQSGRHLRGSPTRARRCWHNSAARSSPPSRPP